MLEKGPWYQSSGEAFSASFGGNSKRKILCSTPDESRTSNRCMKSSKMDSVGSEVCTGDPILGYQTAAVESNLGSSLYHYQLNTANKAENGFGFFGDNLQDKESSNLLYDGWPYVENFEEFDRMFRSCDPTFGLGNDNEDEFGWFSSSHAIERPDDALKSSLNLSGFDPRTVDSIITDDQETHGLNDTGLLGNECDKKATPASLKIGSPKLTSNGPSTVMNYSYANRSGAVPRVEGDPQINSYVSQSKHQRPSEGERNNSSLDNGDSFMHFDNKKQVRESNHSLDFQCPLLEETHQQPETKNETCLQIPIASMNSNNGHTFSQVLPSPMASLNNAEDNDLPSVFPRESCHASNSMQSNENSRDISFKNPSVSGDKKNDRHHKKRLSGHAEESNLMFKRADSDPVSSQKQVPKFVNEVEGQSEVNGVDIGILGELDSPSIQDSSCLSSVLDEVSTEARSFCQLQHVMEQLNIKTKLCIRDSLYRLAWSAEQRHKCVNETSRGQDAKDANRSDGRKKCTGFMDMETDTNPIDRSIAHLLFHRPLDPSTATLDAVPMKSRNIVHEPNHVPVTAEKLVCQQPTLANGEATDTECENCET